VGFAAAKDMEPSPRAQQQEEQPDAAAARPALVLDERH